MANVLFIVWRESLEAVLVVGILYAYVARLGTGRRGPGWLAGGVAGGLLLSVLLAFATLRIESDLQGEALQYFQVGMMALAGALLTQMVIWMSRHGRRLKRSLEADLDRAVGTGSLMGIGIVALLAVAREGAETVLYLYSLGIEDHQGSALPLVGAAALGFVLALATAALLSRGVRFLSYRTFFRVTGVVLLFTAAGMMVSAVSQLIGMGVLPGLMDPVWNTAMVLDSNSRIGGIVSTLTGYRSQPSLMLVLAYVAYWTVVVTWLRRGVPAQQPAPSAAPAVEAEGNS